MIRSIARALHRVLQFARWRSLDAASREELQFHVDAYVAALVRDGLPEPEARRVARLELGDVDVEAARLADRRAGARIYDLLRSIRHAGRALARAKVFTVVSALLIAVGVGASTSIFTAVDRVLLRPLALPDAEGLVRLYESSPARQIPRSGVARGNLAEWRARSKSFSGLASFYTVGRTLSEDDRAEVVSVAQVTCDFFPILRVTPLAGTTFTEEQCREARFNSAVAPIGVDAVLVLSEALWRRRFGADPAVVGRVVMLDRRPFRIVGVMPRDVDVVAPRAEAFIAWQLDADLPYDQRYTIAIGRLRSGVGLGPAGADIASIAADIAQQRPQTNRDWTATVVPLQGDTIAGLRPVLYTLLVASGLLLLIACANVAILFSARALARTHEVALHLALGASRGRIVQQGLVEAALVAAVGGALGAVGAVAVIAWIRNTWTDLPRVSELAPDGPVLAFGLAATLLSAVLAGLAPSLRQARAHPADALRVGRRTGGSREENRRRNALVAGEIALTAVLLAGAGLLLRSVAELRATDPGFDARDVVVAPVFLDGEKYSSGAASRAYYDRLFARLRAIPGVVAVGAATTLPTTGLGPGFTRPAWPLALAGDDRAVRQPSVRIVTPGYLESLRIPVLEGRVFDIRDVAGGRPVVAVSERLGRAMWPGRSPVGEQLVVDYSTAGTYPYEVVGVVGNVRFDGPRSEPAEEVYFAHAQKPYLIMNVAVRAAPGTRLPLESVRAALREIDPLKPPHGVHRLEDLLGATYLRERRATRLLSVFAGVAALLCALGIYGVIAYRVRHRTRDIGVRVALGATRRDVIRWVVGEVGRPLVIGGVVGIAAAMAGARFLTTLLYGVAPYDPLTMLVVLGLLGSIATAAACIPAWRAARADPVTALRTD